MDSITRNGSKLVLNEVFEGEIRGFIERGDAFFSVMPNPDTERDLSEHSPLYDANLGDDSDGDSK
jgi:hypothetical protein